MRLKIIAGTGHCGTNWAAEKLTMPYHNVICFHEIKYCYFLTGSLNSVDNIRMKSSLQIDVLDHFLQPKDFITGHYVSFWNSLRSLACRHVGISNDFKPAIVPKLLEVLDDGIALLVRNGINTVQSMYLMKWRYFDFLEKFLGPAYAKKYFGITDKLSYFDYCCIYWSSCFFSAKDGEKHPNFRLFLFEDIIKTRDGFRDFFRWFCPEAAFEDEDISRVQNHNIGKKNKGPRNPAKIWDIWDRKKKESFKRFCQEAMGYFGYQI